MLKRVFSVITVIAVILTFSGQAFAWHYAQPNVNTGVPVSCLGTACVAHQTDDGPHDAHDPAIWYQSNQGAGCLEVVGYTGDGISTEADGTTIIIPDSIVDSFGDATVGIIGNGALGGLGHILNIILPDTVHTIRGGAFAWCTSLQTVNIPNGVGTIEAGTFEGCMQLNNVVLPDSVTSIGANAFNFCWALGAITIPASVTSIASDAFFPDAFGWFTIYGYTGSYAEDYAISKEIKFVDITPKATGIYIDCNNDYDVNTYVITTSIANQTGSSISGALFVALYDVNRKLISIDVRESISVDANGQDFWTYYPVASTIKYIKCFVWDGTANIKPNLYNEFTITTE